MIYVFEIGFFLFAFFSAKEEVAFTWPFRELTPEHFPSAIKDRESKLAHNAGAWGVSVLLAMILVAGIMGEGILPGVIAALLCACIYSLVFDCRYSSGIGKGLFYLGNTARTDQDVLSFLGKYGGKLKALILTVVIIALNLVYALLLR